MLGAEKQLCSSVIILINIPSTAIDSMCPNSAHIGIIETPLHSLCRETLWGYLMLFLDAGFISLQELALPHTVKSAKTFLMSLLNSLETNLP